MRAIEKNRLQVLRRARDFVKPMADDPRLTSVVDELDSLIERATAEGVRQERMHRQARSATAQIAALATELREDLLSPLSTVVRKVARGEQVNGKPIEVLLRLPRERDHVGLLAAADAIHALALPHQAQLLAAGLPSTLLDELRDTTVALRAAIDARAQDYLNRAHARASGAVERRNAREALMLVHALLRKQLRGNAALRQAWHQARRVGRRGSVAAAEPGVAVTPEVVTPPGTLTMREPGETSVTAERVAGEVAKAA